MNFEQKIEDVLEELEKTAGIYWNISRETAEYIYKLADAEKFANILEIGTSNGYAGMTDFITQIKGHAPEFFERLELEKGSLDMIFVDATKAQYAQIYDAAWPFLKVGGMIVGDNIRSPFEILEPFVNRVLSSQNAESEIVEIGTGLLISIKLN